VQGGLAAAGLLAALVTWQRETVRSPGEALVIDATRNELERVRYEDDKGWAELERRREGGEPSVWLRLSARAEPKTPQREVRGNDAAEKLYERFTPLRAIRSLGVLDPAKLKELGLDTSKKRLEITARGAKHRFVIGAPVGVSTDPYLRDERDGRVYVVARAATADLDSAAVRLMDRKLHVFKLGEVDSMTIKAGAKQRELRVQARGDDLSSVKLTPPNAPEKPDEMAKNWHDKLWRLFPMDVLGKGEVPITGAPQPVVRVNYAERGKSVGWIELAIGGTDPLARTEHTPGWVKLHTTAEIVNEGEKIAGAE